MITKTFICDCCKKSVGEAELVNLTILADILKNADGRRTGTVVNKDVCADCLNKKGVLSEVPEGQKFNDVLAKNQKTLEDKILDFLADLGVMFEQ